MKYILMLLALVGCGETSEQIYDCSINHKFYQYTVDSEKKLVYGTDLPNDGVDINNNTHNSVTFKQEDGRMVVIQKYDMVAHIHGLGYSVDGTCKKIK